MPQYTVKNDKGREVTFDWHGSGEPTDADMEEVFAAAGPDEPSGPQGSATSRYFSNLWQQVDPRNLGHAVMHPQDTVKSIVGASKKNWEMGREGFDRASKPTGTPGDLMQGLYRTVGAFPVLGPMATGVGDQIQGGDYAGAAGAATGIGLLSKLPKASSAVAREIPNATGRIASGVSGTARTMVEHPFATAAGVYEGYQAGGIPGAVAGAVGLPVGLRGFAKLLRPAVSHADDADAKWAQEAKNLNARDAFLKKQAAQEANDLSVHERMQERIQKATTREQVTAAKEQWNSILQEAKNLNAREKKLAEIAAEEAATARFNELFPDGGERSAPAARVISSTKKDGVRTTTAELIRPKGTAAASAADELVKSVQKRMTESVGIADMASDFRELSRKTVLTPEEMQRFTALKRRMEMSASESGLSYPAAQSPRRYTGRNEAGTMQLNPRKALGGDVVQRALLEEMSKGSHQ